MSIPDKIYWFLGYNDLALILEQEKKHWLLKTDKKKQLQDKYTGDVFLGQIDNIGSDIIIETEKMPFKNDSVASIKYVNTASSKILSIYSSAFAYSSMVNGLMFARITSTEYPLNVGGIVQYKNYKIKFKDCKECTILFGGSINTSDVFCGRWLKTSTAPTVMMIGPDGAYSIERTLDFDSSITNTVYYYPLTEALQPLSIESKGDGVYETLAVNDDGLIGYPLYWFTCDQTDVGPTMTFSHNINSAGNQLMFISNSGNSSKYNAKLYAGIDGNCNATPDGTATSNYTLQCTCKSGYTFSGVSSDADIPIDPTSISMVNKDGTSTAIGVTCTDNDIITLSLDKVQWVRKDTTATISLSVFDTNCLQVAQSPLTEAFNVHFDENVSFATSTNDVGYAGVRMGSSNMTSDIYDRYPYDLNKWDGLPKWLTNIDEGAVPQHMAIYAIHNTPTYTPDIPNSRQVAAILLDPGKMKTKDSTDETSNDERGRGYMISNDSIEYENNATSKYPKPARTVARICDVPTSVMQLSGISGLAPTQVVDKQYVRSEASYKSADKDRLYNILGDRWVRPTALDKYGVPVNDPNSRYGEHNDFVFTQPYEGLKAVDLVDHNDFRHYENINPMVNPANVTIGNITEQGTGYAVGDIGVVIVGGFAFHYTVTKVGTDGNVTELGVTPADSTNINLSNFSMTADMTGYTEPYGTSPLTGNGVGLKFRFMINEYSSIITHKGEIFDNLFAFSRESDGLWLWQYDINTEDTSTPKMGEWNRSVLISEFEQSSTSKGINVSTQESYINSIIPSMRNIMTAKQEKYKDPTTVLAFSTASFINIIDETKSPLKSTISSNEDDAYTRIDMSKFYCTGLRKIKIARHNITDVIAALNAIARYDSYVVWRWNSTSQNDTSVLEIVAGVISRSFNNFMTTDSTTMLPKNSLNCNNYVHSNQSTTIVWNVDKVGAMMWTYNPKSSRHETYFIDKTSYDFGMTTENITWADVDFRNTVDGSSTFPQLVDSVTGVLNYNILTNNPAQINETYTDKDPIYQQPKLTEFISINTNISNIDALHQPMGVWQLVFPRVNTFTITNKSGMAFNPVRLQAIRCSNISNDANITDESGNVLNAKSVVIDTVGTDISLKLFNSDTGTWNKI